VERAQKLLTGANLSLSEIALASGFSDQSHLARHFSAACWRISEHVQMVEALVS
jgi:transcriptional regulator GlxA family with amidase domain